LAATAVAYFCEERSKSDTILVACSFVIHYNWQTFLTRYMDYWSGSHITSHPETRP